MLKSLVFICSLCFLLASCQQPTEEVRVPIIHHEVVDTTKAIIEEEEEGPVGDIFGDAKKINWSMLAKVKFESRYNEAYGENRPFPFFSEELKALDGKSVYLRGYVIPIEETGSDQVVFLSAFPFSQCFFCGASGPETVIEIDTKKKNKRLKMDKQATFKGILELNDSDESRLMYSLQEAELIDAS